MASQTTEMKQSYLYEEIVGQGYDPEVFMNYMAEIKEDGTNIDNWAMVELINIVNEYKSKYSSNGALRNQDDQSRLGFDQLNSSRSTNRSQQLLYDQQNHDPQQQSKLNQFQQVSQSGTHELKSSQSQQLLKQEKFPKRVGSEDDLFPFSHTQKGKNKFGLGGDKNKSNLNQTSPDFDENQNQESEQFPDSTLSSNSNKQVDEQSQNQKINKPSNLDCSLLSIGIAGAYSSQQQPQNKKLEPSSSSAAMRAHQTPSSTSSSTVPSNMLQSQTQVYAVESIRNSEDTSLNQYFQYKECKKSPNTVVGVNPDLTIQITDHQILKGSLFGSSQIVLYSICTLPFNWVVKRRNSDFLWLRNLLVKQFPGISIPPIPGKTVKTLNEKLIERRKGYFQSFLSELLSHPDIKSSKHMTDFLSIADEKIFMIKVKESDRLLPPKNLSEIETITGKVQLNRHPQCNVQATQINELLETSDACYVKLKKQSKLLIEAFNEVGNVLKQMGETFAQMHYSSALYNQKVMSFAQVKEHEDIYTILNNMCIMEANIFTKKIKLFQNNFYNFFKYHKDNFQGFKSVLKTRNELASALAKKDNSSSGSIFKSSKEQINQPSKTLKELEEQVAYYNDRTVEGSRKMIDFRTQLAQVWQDISDNFQNVLTKKQGKKLPQIMNKSITAVS